MIAAPRWRVLGGVAALLASLQSAAQPAATAQMSPVAGQSVFGEVVFVERDAHLDVKVRLVHMPAGLPFELHLADHGPCLAGPGAAASGPAIVPDVPRLRADSGGYAVVLFTLANLTLGPGPNSIAGLPVGIYAPADRGGAALACGQLGPHRELFTTTQQSPLPRAPLSEVRACMDSEDRVVALDRRNDAERAAIEGATSAAARDAWLEVWTRHEAEFQATLRTHSQRCGTLQASTADRAAVLAERRDAASGAR